MPDLLLELRSEEIPARMQRKAAGDLRKMITDGLVEAGLTYEAAREYWTPRRLTLDLRGLTARSKDVHEERKGPSTKAPEQAIQGFLRAAGLSDISQAHVHSDPKKGDFYVAHLSKPGRAAEDIIAELVPSVIRAFPWPKSMRWGPASAKPGSLRWVRPLQSIVCTFGPETEEPMVVDFEIDGIRAGNVTYGHRFHAPSAITVRRFEDYAAKLEAAKVVIDADRRKEIILSDARNLAFARGLELVEDEGLLEEVSGLVEWPVVLMGEFEEDFLAIPPEVIRLTIRANQKCFVVRPSRLAPLAPQDEDGLRQEPSSGQASPSYRDEGGQHDGPHPEVRAERASKDALSNHFLLTANIEAKDGGREIAHGNGKVVRARLSDALYFWKTDQADLPDLDQLQASAEKFGLDLKKPLDQRMARLDHLNVTFHAKLGTQGERVERIARLAEELAPIVARSMAPSSGPSGHLLPVGEKSATAMSATSSPQRGEGGSRSEPGEGDSAKLARRAAVLAKADLTTEIVGEFPELQGAMGRKYALLQGEHPSVAAAIEEHYKPQGPSDRVPTDPVSVAVALADKLDTLVGFWAIDEKPTGSKDPYALRRAALGVVRLVLENGVRLPLSRLCNMAHWQFLVREAKKLREIDSARETASLANRVADWGNLYKAMVVADQFEETQNFSIQLQRFNEEFFRRRPLVVAWALGDAYGHKHPEIVFEYLQIERANVRDLLSFFHDRLKVYLRDQGARHDLIDAVLSNAPSSGPSGLPVGEKSQAAMSATSSPRRGEGGSRSEPGEGDMMPQPQQPYDVEAGHEGRHLPLEGGGRAAGAGGGVGVDPSAAGHPTPALRADPPPQGEGDGRANDDLLTIVRRVEALGSFLATDEGKNLLAGTKRAANILAAEEKKKTAVAPTVDPSLFRMPAEETLFAAVNQAERQAAQAIQNEDFSAAMLALSALREPVDSFFEQVLVNDEDLAVRANRLALLSRIRAATDQVADFSKIAG